MSGASSTSPGAAAAAKSTGNQNNKQKEPWKNHKGPGGPSNRGQGKPKQDGGQQNKSISVQARGKGSGPIMSKNIFDTPFRVQWPPVNPADLTLIYQKLASTFKNLQIRSPRIKKSDKPPTTTDQMEISPTLAADDLQETIDMAPPAKRQKLEPSTPTVKLSIGENISAAALPSQLPQQAEFVKDERMKHIVLGINAVTKNLEKGKLALVIVCKQIEPPRVLAHLPALCALRGDIPLCPLGDSSHTLGQYFGLNSVLALGFKKSLEGEGGQVLDCMKFIISKTPKIEVPWISDHIIKQSELALLSASAASAAVPAPVAVVDTNEDKMDLEQANSDSPQVRLKLQPLSMKKIEYRPNSTSTKKPRGPQAAVRRAVKEEAKASKKQAAATTPSDTLK